MCRAGEVELSIEVRNSVSCIQNRGERFQDQRAHQGKESAITAAEAKEKAERIRD